MYYALINEMAVGSLRILSLKLQMSRLMGKCVWHKKFSYKYMLTLYIAISDDFAILSC